MVAWELAPAQVSVYFNNKLLRGNRTTKVDNSSLDAFHSPNIQPIAKMKIDIKGPTLLIPPSLSGQLGCSDGLQ